VGWSERGKADRVAAFPASVLNFHFRGRLSSKLSNLNKAQHKCAWQPLAKLPLWPSSPGESPPNNVPAMLEWSQHTHSHTLRAGKSRYSLGYRDTFHGMAVTTICRCRCSCADAWLFDTICHPGRCSIFGAVNCATCRRQKANEKDWKQSHRCISATVSLLRPESRNKLAYFWLTMPMSLHLTCKYF